MTVKNDMMISHHSTKATAAEIAKRTSDHRSPHVKLDKLGNKRALTTDLALCGLPSPSSNKPNGLGHLNSRNNHHKPASSQFRALTQSSHVALRKDLHVARRTIHRSIFFFSSILVFIRSASSTVNSDRNANVDFAYVNAQLFDSISYVKEI